VTTKAWFLLRTGGLGEMLVSAALM